MISRVILTSLLFGGITACVQDEAPDFCKNHYEFHAQHADASARLNITMSDNGDIQSLLAMPGAALQESASILGDVANVYTLETATQCTPATTATSRDSDTLRATYTSACGADNKIGQLNVLLFESLPELEEVIVDVTTPATQKHFAIHRQCSNAIFRLK